MEYLSLALLAGLAVWAIVIYNRLVLDRNRVDAGWSDIDVQLKRRHDLIPKLVEAVRRYTAYEQATLSTLAELRTREVAPGDVGERGRLEAQIGQGMHTLVALAEAYPDLKADRSFNELLARISEVENDIQHARRYYNGTVRNLNTRIDSFPDLLLARLFTYRHREYFEYDPA